MRCRRVIFPHPLQVLMKCWTPSFWHPSHSQLLFRLSDWLLQENPVTVGISAVWPELSTQDTQQVFSQKSQNERVVGVLQISAVVGEYRDIYLLQHPSPPPASFNIPTLQYPNPHLPHSTSQSSDADCYLGVCGKCMGVYSGGRGISHYPLASISRIFWQLTLIYKQYTMEMASWQDM